MIPMVDLKREYRKLKTQIDRACRRFWISKQNPTTSTLNGSKRASPIAETSLPMFPDLTEEEIVTICQVVKRALV